MDKKIIKNKKNIKILSNGDLTKKITIKDINITKAAKEKVEKAGGTVEKSKVAGEPKK
jgi:large subunit ribosomal protein L15